MSQESSVYKWLKHHKLGNADELKQLKHHLNRISMNDVHKVKTKLEKTQTKWKSNAQIGGTYLYLKSICDLYNWYITQYIIGVPSTTDTCPKDATELPKLIDMDAYIETIKTGGGPFGAPTATPFGSHTARPSVPPTYTPFGAPTTITFGSHTATPSVPPTYTPFGAPTTITFGAHTATPSVPPTNPFSLPTGAQYAVPQPVMRPINASSFVGKIVQVHGEVSHSTRHFTVPNNTYIVFTTTLGRYGAGNESTRSFMELFTDRVIAKDLLYLLAFDYDDTFLSNIPYLKNRVIYTPLRKCVNSVVSDEPISDIECGRVFEYGTADRSTGSAHYTVLKTDPITNRPITSIEHTDASFLGIYDVPIVPVPGMTDTLIPSSERRVPQDISYKLDKLPSADPTLPNQIYVERTLQDQPIPGYKYATQFSDKYATIYDHRTGRTRVVDWDPTLVLSPYEIYIHSDHPKNPTSVGTTMCGINKYDAILNYKRIQDYSGKPDVRPIIRDNTGTSIRYGWNDPQRNNMLFSDLVTALRAETDRNYGPEQKLIIVATQCRAFEKAGRHTEVCLRIENSMVKFLRKIQTTEHKAMREHYLGESMRRLISRHSLTELQTNLADNSDFQKLLPVETWVQKRGHAVRKTIEKAFEAEDRVFGNVSNANSNINSDINYNSPSPSMSKRPEIKKRPLFKRKSKP